MNALRGISRLAHKLGWVTRARRRSEPRTLPSHGFNLIDDARLLEEEGLPEYDPHHFYPVRLGEIFNDRFQTVAKLGYGSSSTIWLARDLQDHQYVALKIYIHNSAQHRELPFYEELNKALPSQHIGAENIRKLLGSFKVNGPFGTHIVLVLQTSQMSLRDMDTVFRQGRGFDENFVKSAIKELLQALDFLHTKVQVVHTGQQPFFIVLTHSIPHVHPGNLLLGIEDNSLFKTLEDTEMTNPVCRKNVLDRTIYSSRLMKPKVGPLLLSDFGEARIGPGPHAGDIMPIVYRAPETLLWIQWSYAVDIWSVGLTAWDLLEGKTLFSARKADGSFSDGVHFSELIAALGPPPRDLLNRHHERALEYWDENGNWGDFVPIPSEKTLEAAETKLKDKTKFLQFMRRTLAWDPKIRPTAKELMMDPWLLEEA
ncbi:protein kinase, putative [Metarhizium acridum CQMa 102]|uniref:non-specific serine/threonine protein kinase n=1 Tax=Metarhizium acridum (strain CQMa 102) TaxID=655827 RepID=E9E7N0_METAQ|nr:protein kinase, putative [Metarhizium acridum CQMa 102]EFY88140.1 protein kinase, putative [Metarhizium acridum CQMa 102]